MPPAQGPGYTKFDRVEAWGEDWSDLSQTKKKRTMEAGNRQESSVGKRCAHRLQVTGGLRVGFPGGRTWDRLLSVGAGWGTHLAVVEASELLQNPLLQVEALP